MDYILGLGSNLGSRHAHLMAAIALLRARTAEAPLRVSPCYESDPVGPIQPRYLNAALRLQTSLAPSRLLAELHAIEHGLGRRREHEQRWGARVLDLDILWASQPSDGPAVIPHPRLPERWFALRPLLDVAPDLEPRYAPALRALAPQPLRVEAAARAELRADAGRIELGCRASDLAEALAATLTALGRALCPGVADASLPPETLEGETAIGQEAAGCVNAVLASIARGTTFGWATIAELAAGRFSARLLPGATSAAPPHLAVAALQASAASGTIVVHVRR